MPNVETFYGVIVAIAALVTAFIQYRKAKLEREARGRRKRER
jgi:hypothetical protein